MDLDIPQQSQFRVGVGESLHLQELSVILEVVGVVRLQKLGMNPRRQWRVRRESGQFRTALGWSFEGRFRKSYKRRSLYNFNSDNNISRPRMF